MTSGFSSIVIALDELHWQLEVEFLPADGAKAAADILKPDIDKLRREWGFQRMFLGFIDQWTDAVLQQRGLKSLVTKIKALEDEIMKDLNVACQKKYGFERPPKLAIEILCQSLEKIEVLKPEIGAALDFFPGCNSIRGRSPLPNDFFSWTSFVHLVEDNLVVVSRVVDDHDPDLAHQIDDLRNKLSSLAHFLCEVGVGRSEKSLAIHEQRVKDFFSHVASFTVRTAYEFSAYWFKKMNDDPNLATTSGSIAREKLLILLQQQQIDPVTSSNFLELTIQLLKAINILGYDDNDHNAVFFLDYFLGVRQGGLHHRGLKYLVSMLINNQEDDQSLFSDVAAVLREALPLRDVLLGRGLSFALQLCKSVSPPSCEAFNPNLWLLEQKIWHLKIEFVLKEKVSSSTIFLKNVDLGITDNVVGLGLLRTFFKYLPEEELEKRKQILTELEAVARETESLGELFDGKKSTQSKVKDSLSMLHLRTVLLKARSFLLDLSSRDVSFMVFEKDQLEALHEGLKLLMLFVTNHPMENRKNVELLFTRAEVVARGIVSLCCTFLANKLTEAMTKQILVSFSDCLDNVKLLLTELREMCPRFLRSNFPKTDGLGFIGFLLGSMEKLLKRDPDSIAPVKHYIKEICSDLESLRSLLMKLDDENPKLKNIGKDIIEIAYEVEHAIDSIEVGIGSTWQHFVCLYYLLEEIRLVKMQASRIYEQKTNVVDRVRNVTHISRHEISQAGRPNTEKLLVPLRDQEEMIVDRLTRGSSQREIVPIIGMPGIGKTTLAKEVYHDPKVTYLFQIRAWCSVSQEYEKRELLLEILSNISALTDSIHQMSDEDLDLKLYQHLKRKKYLIVMDDVWNICAWKDMENSFPDDRNGSRILITSRLHDVARKFKSGTVPHSLRLLTNDESWKLLQMKVFHERGCPEELLGAGKKIARNCEGLPLAIVAIAGLLRRTEENQEKWGNVAENLSSLIVDNPETRCKDILELSYKHLPAYLKPCFLYFGAFQECKDILIRKLILLWVAEGFIQKTESKSLEDVAEDYLMDLIDSSLVIFSKKRANGRGKAWRIHDMWRDLCLSKAREENFFQLITRHDEPYASFDDSDYGADFHDYFASDPITYEAHRLCICLKRKHFVLSRPSGPCTRSLIFFAVGDTYPRCPYDVSFISHHFKLLRVLDVEAINVGVYFPDGILLLVQLRFLAVSGDMDTIPPSISDLGKLETFIVKGLKGRVMLPSTIWFMARLRHVRVNNHAAFSLQDDKLGRVAQLNNLITLSSPSFSFGEDTKRILQKLPNLHKLRCIFVESWDCSRDCNQFPVLSFLSQLESLKIFYSGRARNPGELNFPANLKRLTLSNFRLPWHRISDIGRLQNLEVLKLFSRAFEGQTWDMTEGEFLNLKFLKLDSLNISQWNATSDHLPKLQHLVLRSCKDLEEESFAFWEIPTLEMIEVKIVFNLLKSRSEELRRRKSRGSRSLSVIQICTFDSSSC